MNPEGDQGVNLSGSALQDAGTTSPRSGKRSRSQNEEGRHPTALGIDTQYVKTMDLNLTSDNVSSEDGADGREGQGSYSDGLTLFQSEKRIKCGPSNLNSPRPIPGSLTVANVDVIASGGGNNVIASGGGNNVIPGVTGPNVSQVRAALIGKISNKGAEAHASGIGGLTQLWCDICSVKSTSMKDLETHLAGKRHAKAKDLALGRGASITKSSGGSFKSKALTHQEVLALTEHGSTDIDSNIHSASMGQQVLGEGSCEASAGHHATGTNVEEVNFWSPSSKCPDSSAPNAVAVGQRTSTDCPSSMVEAVENDPPNKVACDNGHKRDLFLHAANGSAHKPSLADGFLEKLCCQATYEGDPYKHIMVSLSGKSNSDCVARALASALSIHGCPGLGDLQEGSSCEQAAPCSIPLLEGAKSAGGNGFVTMHTRCFSTLLQDVRVCVLEDLCQNGGQKASAWLPSAAPISDSAGGSEDLNCSVCRVEYGSKADLDLHLAGRKHASLVQRVFSRCQLCNLNCNTERDFKTHLSGKKHASKLRLVQKRVTF